MFTDSLWDGIEGIVFDAVGTLIKPVPPVADVYCAAALRQAITLDPDHVRDRFLHHFRADELVEARGPMATSEANELARWRRIVKNVLGELPDPEKAFNELWTHFGSSEAWSCFADVGPTLELLQDARLPLRIASNFDARLRNVVAGLPALAGLADALVISSEVGYRKPHPRFYETVAATFERPPETILWIGDEPENDVRGARAAGFRAVLLDRGGRADGDPMVLADLHALTARWRGRRIA